MNMHACSIQAEFYFKGDHGIPFMLKFKQWWQDCCFELLFAFTISNVLVKFRYQCPSVKETLYRSKLAI